MPTPSTQRTYDHRLIRLVQQTGDATIATRIGVPRSTVAGWLRRPLPAITTAPRLDEPVASPTIGGFNLTPLRFESESAIYNWEKGKGKPRAKALAAWAEVRGIGKREAWKRLELLGE